MAEMTWEKQSVSAGVPLSTKLERYKFLAGGALILAAVLFMVFSSTFGNTQFFVTVDDVVAKSAEYVGQTVRVTGAVVGETINYDPNTGDLSFTIAHVPNEFTDLATALHEAVNNESANRMTVFLKNQAMPDLLQHEAQAILTGVLYDDGSFHATELLLKCPSRFQETIPGSEIHKQNPDL